MRHSTLRELAKVGFGIVVGDIISVFAFNGTGILPLAVLGIHWTAASIPELLVFDVAILLLLAHYGWSMKLPIESPSERTLLVIAGVVFVIVALLHLARLAFGWHVVLGDFRVPMWYSWVGVAIAGYLSYSSFHFAMHTKRR